MAEQRTDRVAVAMSGGVDSSVAAALLLEAGWRVRGVFMRLGQPGQERQEGEARAVAAKLGVELAVVDLAEEFARLVIAPFVAAYAAGSTPNPCVLCNRLIKSGRLLAEAVPRYGNVLATGHYARLMADGRGGRWLLRGADRRKDQSYFLCRLEQTQLRQLLLPLGELSKEAVRRLAVRFGIEASHGEESQDVCFLRGQSVAQFVEDRAVVTSGPIRDLAGRELGRHAGLHRYTIGQRRGLGIPDATPWYVVALDPDDNAVVVGKEEDLLGGMACLRDLHWLAGPPPELPFCAAVQLRYRHSAANAVVEAGGDGRQLLVRFDTPQRAITPGQYAVLYQGERVVGSGEIARG
ncbi:MAG: tRNA 2-thiouridine(34) synthase MnmA [Thermodesulfobacteriota bacterium]